MAVALCSLCEALDLSNFVDSDNDIQTVFHQKSLDDLQRSAQSCALCRLLNSVLTANQEYPGPKQTESAYTTPVLLRAGQDLDEEGNQKGIYTVRVRVGSNMTGRLGLYVDEESLVVVPQELIIGKKIRPPEQRFDLVKEWLQQCNQHHGCQPPFGKLPARVIDVGKDGAYEPFLKITAGEEGRYVALSHCWGKKPLIRTTKATLPHHMSELPMLSLPKTFQDAITITRMMGIQYLWIDSLCIVQDDMEDWEREAAIMGECYSRSYLTIAATAANDSSKGCFQHRPTDTHVRVKYTMRKGKVGHVFLRDRPRGFEDLSTSPLNTRAWVTQERLLSPRIIHFDVDQLLWECRERRYTEDGVPPEAYIVQRAVWDGRFRLDYSASSEIPWANMFAWDWYEMLDHYTRCGLTNPGDKLPALSGLASVMESRTKEKYVAGLWESHLNVGMLWKREVSDPWLNKTTKYRAPSWSWAAYDGRITIPDRTFIEGISSFELMASEIVANTTAAGLDPNGQLASGSISIAARLKRIDLRIDPESAGYEPCSEPGGHDHIRENGEIIGWVNFDQKYDGDEVPLYCLQMTRKQHPHRQLCHVLVLKETGVENQFERAGMGFTGGGDIRSSGWFDATEKSSIVII